MDENDGEGNDLSGADQGDEEETEEEETEDGEEDNGDGDNTETDDDEVTITIDGQAPEDEEPDTETAPNWVKEVRKENREKARRIRELESQLAAKEPVTKVPELGKKPSMDDSDIDWDAEKFEVALTAWHDRKRQIDQAEQQRLDADKKQKEEWQSKLNNYASKRDGLKVRDFAEAEEVIQNVLSTTQQGIIVQGADDPATIVYALGKNPKVAAKLAAITDNVQFAFAIAKLEATRLKVKGKKTAPPPEKVVTGQGRITGAVDSTLERLREEAAKSGDLSKVNAYKRAQKAKAKK